MESGWHSRHMLGEWKGCSPGSPPTHKLIKRAVHKNLFIEDVLWHLYLSTFIMLIHRKQFFHDISLF